MFWWLIDATLDPRTKRCDYISLSYKIAFKLWLLILKFGLTRRHSSQTHLLYLSNRTYHHFKFKKEFIGIFFLFCIYFFAEEKKGNIKFVKGKISKILLAWNSLVFLKKDIKNIIFITHKIYYGEWYFWHY